MQYQFSALAEALSLTGSVIDTWLPNSLAASNQAIPFGGDTDFADPYIEATRGDNAGFRTHSQYTPPQTSLDYLPNGAGGQNASGGFTCTGLDRLANGNWLVGNDGRTAEGDTTHDCSLVILSADKTTIIDEWDMTAASLAGNGTVQGVAVHTDGSYYVAAADQDKILHVSNLGVKLGEIAATDVNGLAYNPDENQLLWKSALNGTVHVYDLDTSSEVDTWTVQTNIDQLSYSNGALWCTQGVNGVNGDVYIYDATNHRAVGILTNLVDAQAIEGIYVSAGKITIANDGGFHVAANPARSMLLDYDLDTSAFPARTRFLGVHGRLKLNGSSPSGKGVLIDQGKPNDSGGFGWALYEIANNRVRLQVRQDTLFWLVEYDVTRGVDFDFSFYVDFDGETTYGEINGSIATPFRILGAYTNIDMHLNLANLHICRSNETSNFYPLNSDVKTIAITSTLSEFNAQAVLIQSDPVIEQGVTVSAALGVIDYSSQSTSITVTGEVNVTATLGNINYTPQHTTVTLEGVLSIPVTLGQIDYNSNGVTVQLGVGQPIGSVTSSFKPNPITVTFKS